MRMDEGFPDRPTEPDGGDGRGSGNGSRQDEQERVICGRRVAAGGSSLHQGRVRSAVDPPRSIPNRDVKRGSAGGTGGLTAGRQRPRACQRRLVGRARARPADLPPSAAWSSGSSSGS